MKGTNFKKSSKIITVFVPDHTPLVNKQYGQICVKRPLEGPMARWPQLCGQFMPEPPKAGQIWQVGRFIQVATLATVAGLKGQYRHDQQGMELGC